MKKEAKKKADKSLSRTRQNVSSKYLSAYEHNSLTADTAPLFFKVAIIGSGAASLNAAVRLKRLGIDDIAVITEGIRLGTSANAGSDKQTYYRLNPCSKTGDSVLGMARDLFSGGSMHGDTALVEAALSSESFAHLCSLGVEFPFNEYGMYPGYRTDHDTSARATSAGPHTSVMMHEKLLAEAKRLGVIILNNMTVIRILTDAESLDLPHPPPVREEAMNSFKSAPSADLKEYAALFSLRERGVGDREVSVCGVVAINGMDEVQAVMADYVILGTGGPGALYEDSVYPEGQSGSLGIALMSGARACNLTESQFGIASTSPRWNLSGSFQQVVPSYFSCNADGTDRRHFLAGHFEDAYEMCRMIFLKGYEWPFDARKVAGSSLIDLLVYKERVESRRKVFIDFTSNPVWPGWKFSIKGLPDVVREYLKKSHATGTRPVDRLIKMNPAAYGLFLSKGVDLRNEPLEIAVCNQHLNGGLAVDRFWETGIRNLFAVGEAAGTHGTYRPGGSALNAGQAGSLRAARCIAQRIRTDDGVHEKRPVPRGKVFDSGVRTGGRCRRINLEGERLEILRRVSATLGIIREKEAAKKAIASNSEQLARHFSSGIRERSETREWFRNVDLLVTERAMLDASVKLLERMRFGRGSFICRQALGQDIIGRIDTGKYLKSCTKDFERLSRMVIETWLEDNGEARSEFIPVRPMPEPEDWFEAVWDRFVKGEVFKA